MISKDISRTIRDRTNLETRMRITRFLPPDDKFYSCSSIKECHPLPPSPLPPPPPKKKYIHNYDNLYTTRGPWATTLTLMYSYDGYIQPKYGKCCTKENLTFRLLWQLIKFSSLDSIYMVVRRLLKESYSKKKKKKLLSKYLKSVRNKGILSLFPL